jgi:hypothetical protein
MRCLSASTATGSRLVAGSLTISDAAHAAATHLARSTAAAPREPNACTAVLLWKPGAGALRITARPARHVSPGRQDEGSRPDCHEQLVLPLNGGRSPVRGFRATFHDVSAALDAAGPLQRSLAFLRSHVRTHSPLRRSSWQPDVGEPFAHRESVTDRRPIPVGQRSTSAHVSQRGGPGIHRSRP